MMNIIKYPERSQWAGLMKRPVLESSRLETAVANILNEVKQHGDEALKKFALKFDGVKLENLQVSENEFEEAVISEDLKLAMQAAYDNIYRFHAAQQERGIEIETMPGVRCWRKSVAIERVGLYIPGGSAPLFSTVLMLGIPARIAGCKEIILCTPPLANGSVHPAVLYATRLTGISRVFKTGGAQAIAAMAYGTASVPGVYKIFGPGNQYVTCAKQLVQKEGLAIDMPAGPSEVAVVADSAAKPAFVAADLLSQAEHGPDSQVLLVSDSAEMINEVMSGLEQQLRTLPRKDVAARALENSRAVLLKSKTEALEFVNEYAPEHLIIACSDARELAEGVVNAGSVFIGNYSCESAGDYASGTNHTLPTNTYAKAYSGVSLDSFVKKITFQELTKEGLDRLGDTIEAMAGAEGLEAHKNAVSVRRRKNK